MRTENVPTVIGMQCAQWHHIQHEMVNIQQLHFHRSFESIANYSRYCCLYVCMYKYMYNVGEKLISLNRCIASTTRVLMYIYMPHFCALSFSLLICCCHRINLVNKLHRTMTKLNGTHI